MSIVIATSLPPNLVREESGLPINYDYQKLCIQSWIDCGFRILSVNDPEEIPPLIAKYPEVTFIPATRNASKWTGRKNPYISDLLLALVDAAEPVLGIINSDLLVEPSAIWAEKLPTVVTESMVVAHRCDTNSLLNGVLHRFDGFDCFFFDKATAVDALEDAMPFAMGIPWWDYWLPCVALLNNRQVTVVERPAMMHLIHQQGYSQVNWQEFALFFARSIVHRSEMAPHLHASATSVLVSHCREIAACPVDAPSGEFKRRTEAFGNIFMPSIHQKSVRWARGVMNSTSPTAAAEASNDTFGRFDQRLMAGRALVEARKCARESRWADIGPELISAMNESCEDVNVILMLGEIALRHSDLRTAHRLIALASERRPGSEPIRRKLEAVLDAMQRSEKLPLRQSWIKKLFKRSLHR